MSTSCPILLTHICLSVPSDKAENGEPYQRRRGAGTPLPDSPPAFPMARDAALTASSSSWRRILLMILAITIHNIPGKAQLSAWLSINLPIPLSVHPCTLPIADAELDTAQEDFLGLPSLLPSSFSLLLADGTCLVGSITLHCAVCMGLNRWKVLAAKPHTGRGNCRLTGVSLTSAASLCCQPVVGKNCKSERRLRKTAL